jgi:hypothetical protein
MKIIIKTHDEGAKHTIDLKDCFLACDYKEAFRLAMQLEGVGALQIDKIFPKKEEDE